MQSATASTARRTGWRAGTPRKSAALVRELRVPRQPVPMTMLVYHDSCLHDWWEVHNYNGLPGWQVGAEGHGFGLVGNGLPLLKAAQDALYGCPPNVFPFGRQYGWVNIATRQRAFYALPRTAHPLP